MKRLCALLLSATLCACANVSQSQSSAPVQPARRIVSLMPSLTEDLCALGAGKQLVGVSAYSEDTCAKNVPQVNNFASMDAERVIRLHPDAIVAIPAQQRMTAAVRSAGIRVYFLSDATYADLFTDIEKLGKISGREKRARTLAASLRARTAQLRAGERYRRSPSVFFVEQSLPLWTAGPQSYIATLIALAGGRIATQSLQQPYAQYSTEALARLDPDAIVATGDARLEAVLSREPWRSLRAVRQHRVFILQDGALIARPGPRYNEGLSWLIARLRPLAT